jgi:FkbM family methyltransferase
MSADTFSEGIESAAGSDARLRELLDFDVDAWRVAADQRYAVLDDVLAGQSPAVIYPAASLGRRAAAALMAAGARILALGDGSLDLQGSRVDGLDVLSPAQIAAAHAETPILVASTMFDSAITKGLRDLGCTAVIPVGYLNLRLPDVFKAREYEGAQAAVASHANRAAIESIYSLLADEESRRVFLGKLAYYLTLEKASLDEIRSSASAYFEPSVYTLGTDEIVVDGGAYTGDTLQAFLTASGGKFRSYFAFEPDGVSHESLSRIAATDPGRITAVRAGLGRHTSSARLLSTAGADSRVLGDAEPGGESIPLVGLDEYFVNREAPSLIKMDIEGSEADALLGAEHLIADNAPKLAVSAYHHPSDLWDVPQLIHRLLPGARLFLRHYSDEVDDTVCYAASSEKLMRSRSTTSGRRST